MNTEHFTLDQVIDVIGSLKQEKGVEKLLNSVKEKIFGNDLNDENIEEFKAFVQDFTSIYYLMKKKFREKYRSSGERYFEHLREVVNNILNLPNPNTKKVLIAIAHDSIEDTNKTFEGLSEDYGYEVALAVEAISKEPLEVSEIFIDESIIDKNERIKQSKKIRNEEYFGHLENFETFKNHINSIAISKGIKLTDEELIEIAKNALDVKFADRIHNLSTQWDPNDLEQVRRKVDETKRYFLNIAKETNIIAYNRIKTLILRLEIQLQGASLKAGKIVN